MGKRPEVAWVIRRDAGAYGYAVDGTCEATRPSGRVVTMEETIYSDSRLLSRLVYVPVVARRLRRRKRDLENPPSRLVASGVSR